MIFLNKVSFRSYPKSTTGSTSKEDCRLLFVLKYNKSLRKITTLLSFQKMETTKLFLLSVTLFRKFLSTQPAFQLGGFHPSHQLKWLHYTLLDKILGLFDRSLIFRVVKCKKGKKWIQIQTVQVQYEKKKRQQEKKQLCDTDLSIQTHLLC